MIINDDDADDGLLSLLLLMIMEWMIIWHCFFLWTLHGSLTGWFWIILALGIMFEVLSIGDTWRGGGNWMNISFVDHFGSKKLWQVVWLEMASSTARKYTKSTHLSLCCSSNLYIVPIQSIQVSQVVSVDDFQKGFFLTTTPFSEATKDCFTHHAIWLLSVETSLRLSSAYCCKPDLMLKLSCHVCLAEDAQCLWICTNCMVYAYHQYPHGWCFVDDILDCCWVHFSCLLVR